MRSGVLQPLAGTLMLLDDEERMYVKGVIINKFRGSYELLEPGLKMLEDIINIPVLGVIPYFKHNIEEEDSLNDKEKGLSNIDLKKRQEEFDSLAAIVRDNLDMDKIYKLLKEKFC